MAVISGSDRRQSGWPSSAGARDSSPDSGALHTWSDSPEAWEGSPDLGSPHRDFPTVIDEFCLPVKVSPCCSLFAASPNLATSQPGHRVFACLCLALGVLGNESYWKMLAFWSGFLHENFRQFHQHLPPNNAKFLTCLAWPPPVVFLSSILAPKWAALTLTLCTQHCAPGSHVHVPHQNSTSTRFSTV